MKVENYFFKDLDKTLINDDNLFIRLESYAEGIQKQIYALYKALPTKNDYGYKKACVLIIPNMKIMFVNFSEDEVEEFNDYKDDFIEDLGYLSEKFGFKSILNRPRTWDETIITTINIKQLQNLDNLESYLINNERDKRKIEILTSLMIGSINDPKKITLEVPDTLLKKIKNKIILYDGTQSKFIYQDENTDKEHKRITIQGLAGTGKTELLVQKIRDKYVNESDSRIVYACYNNVLWEDMKKRIPELFDYMKVDEQIKLNQRLWIMKSWGNRNDMNSGICSYICNIYDISFASYSRNYDLENFASDILLELKKRNSAFEPCFDYIFLDESQDFGENFINLCSFIVKKRLYIAGDIFQNIFDNDFDNIEADYVLNKCYRTDPKTLMFAHAVGMGLYEKPVLRWLTDKEWFLCGYSIEKKEGKYELTRKPIRRFEDIEDSNDNIEVREISSQNLIDNTISALNDIKEKNHDIQPNDIAIVFIQTSYKDMCFYANELKSRIYDKFEWETNIGYETKNRVDVKKLFISNANNIKGLEFPFIITIVMNWISDSLHTRNSIYMALTRSFIKSFFFINNPNDTNSSFIDIYKQAASNISLYKEITINEPSTEEKEAAKKRLGAITKKNQREEVYKKIQIKYGLSEEKLEALRILTEQLCNNSDYDDDKLFIKIEQIFETTIL